MSEKRFICGLGFPINSDDPIRIISDSVEDKDYYKFSDICNVLNEQQSTIMELQEIIIDLKDDKNQLHKVISKLRQEVAELKTRNSVLSSKLNQIPKSIKRDWLE